MKKKESLYDIEVIDKEGKSISFSSYKGKILLIVNTATHSSFTSCYKDLERIYRKYKREDFLVLDFPCDQFHGECPENDEEIEEFCTENYNTTFPRFPKGDVVGEKASPLFVYLDKAKKFRSFDATNPLSPVLSSIYIKQGPGWEKKPGIKWNFTKFLVDRYGKVMKRYEATCPMERVEKDILSLLDKEPKELYKEDENR